MTKRKRILLISGASLAGLLLVLLIAAIIIVQTLWFANFAKQRIVATLEESTGGVATIGSLNIDLWHLTVRVRDFVLHGREPEGSDPFFSIKTLELRLKLLSSFKDVLDLRYLGVEQPRVNLMLLPDGSTNIPEPKVPSKPSNTSGLETVVNLAVKEFRINNGLIKAVQQQARLSAQGENLHALLRYSSTNPSYIGNLEIDPLVVSSADKPPLNLHVNIPVTLERDAVKIAGASLDSGQSRIDFSASMEKMNAPILAVRMNARVSLPEIQRSVNLPIDANRRGAPKDLTAQLALDMNTKTNAIDIRQAHLAVGNSSLQASGNLDPVTHSTASFDANFALAELARLLDLTSVQPSGELQANGRVSLDRQGNYAVDGQLGSRGLSVATVSTQVANLSIASPFHFDPYLISMDGLQVNALGGSLWAKIFVEKLSKLSVEGQLRNFSLAVLASAFTGKQLGYDGSLDGPILVKGDLKATGTTGYNASARLNILPGHHGIPVSGRLYANYLGSSGAVNIDHSSIILPNSRLDLDGSLNRRIELKLISSNLGDFLPAANFGSAKPLSSLPVALQDGTAQLTAQVTGNMSAPVLAAHLGVTQFAVEGRPFDNLSLDAEASPSAASIRNGVLEAKGLNTNFDGSLGLHKWEPSPSSPLSGNLTLSNGNLADLMSLTGSTSLQASGTATAAVHLGGTYGDPLGEVHVQVNDGGLNQQQFSNFVTNIVLADQLITLSQLELDTAGGKIASSGTFRHPRDSFMTGHAQIALSVTGLQLAQVKALAKQNSGVAGLVQLRASASGDVGSRNKTTTFGISNVTLDLSARNLEVRNQRAGDLTATARTRNGQVTYKLDSDFAGSTIRADGSTSLGGDYLTKAEATIQDLSVSKALQMAGQAAIPASGDFSAKAQVRGTLQNPSADLNFSLSKANVYQEPVQHLNGSVSYQSDLVSIPLIELKVPAGDVKLSGSFRHPVSDLRSGALALTITSSDIDLHRINHIQQQRPDLRGTLRLAADLSASLRQEHGKQQVLFSKLNANASTAGLQAAEKPIGGMSFTAQTSGPALNFRLDSDIAQSDIHGDGQMQLTGDYPIHSKLSFGSIKLSNFAPLLSQSSIAPLPFEVLLNGEAAVDGPTLDPDNLTARVELNQLDIRTQNAGSTGAVAIRKVELQNRNPIVIALNHEVVQIQQLDIEGHGTSIVASGSVNLKNAASPLALTMKGGVDLGILQDADRDFYSSGSLALDTIIRGSFASPRANGHIELRNANLNYSGAPNGLSNANGTILLSGTSLSIEKLSAESGGGKIALSGFATLGAGIPSFNLKALASKVRVRYAGMSATSDATINLTGNFRRSILAGTVTIQKLTYEGSTDTGSLLSAAAEPPSTPSSPSPVLSGMRLDLHILTAPDIQISSSYANRFSVLANLTVRGTAETPGMLGRVTVTDGQLVFFGNTYTVTTGNINFYDPNSINPVLNFSLQTIAQGVNVTIGVTGPMDNLKLNYRSDPPLSFEQIVQLLATNTTPTNPMIAAHQPAPPQQSVSQMGESAILGQAVANPLASRVQRVFGLTQLKIDPSFSQTNGPSARLTLQQKITSNITFTYTDDVSQPNAQIVRVQLDLSNNLSAVALRDYNSNVSVEVFYKFTRR